MTASESKCTKERHVTGEGVLVRWQGPEWRLEIEVHSFYVYRQLLVAGGRIAVYTRSGYRAHQSD